MKPQITYVSTRPSGAGHWRVTIEVDHDEIYNCITNDSRAVDGYDGGKISLAKECLSKNSYDYDLFDYSLIEEEEQE